MKTPSWIAEIYMRSSVASSSGVEWSDMVPRRPAYAYFVRVCREAAGIALGNFGCRFLYLLGIRSIWQNSLRQMLYKARMRYTSSLPLVFSFKGLALFGHPCLG